MTSDHAFSMPLRVRYFEADQQGVVFNMWYLAYFEDARNGLLEWSGYSLDRLLSSGHDIRLVHAEIDWRQGLRWRDRAEVCASVARVGATSFTFDFDVSKDDRTVVTGTIVYVIVAADSSSKRPVPKDLRRALERVRVNEGRRETNDHPPTT